MTRECSAAPEFRQAAISRSFSANAVDAVEAVRPLPNDRVRGARASAARSSTRDGHPCTAFIDDITIAWKPGVK
jgi:hypothetical protein